MYYWKDVSSSKLFGLTLKIVKKYGEEELICFYLSKCKQTIEEIKNDYENGKSLKDISKENNLYHRWTIKLFKYYNIHIRTVKENADILNKKILPELFQKKYRC